VEPTKLTIPDSRVGQDGIHRHLVTLHHIQHTFRCTRFQHQFRQTHRYTRVLLRRLEDKGVTASHRHSGQPPENGQADLLLNDPMPPVCSPGLLQELAGVEPAEMLCRTQWVCDLLWRDDWQVWLDAAGIEMDNQSGSDQLGFNLYSMVVQAAANGLGFAMGHLRLVENELASGALVAPFELQVPSGKQFYAVYSAHALEREDV